MVDPADSITEPLPVTIPCPIRIDFASEARTYRIVLECDLFDQWTVIRSWGGKANNIRGSRVTHVPSFDAGLAMVRVLAKRREKHGYQTV